MRRALAAGAVALALVLAGCGADDEVAPLGEENQTSPALPSATATASATPPTATAPSAPAPPPDAGVPEGHAAEDQEGGAGDEEAARTPVDFEADGEGWTPSRVEVPPFLAIEVRVRSTAERTLPIRVVGTEVRLRVPKGESRRAELEGLRPGEKYALDVGSGIVGVIVAAEPGP